MFGILRTLQQVGFVEKDADSGKYQLGAALLHLGSSYLDGNELRTRALNWANSLAARSNEAVRIGTLHDARVLVVHHVFRPDDSYQVLQVGSLLPLHATAMGKTLLAANPYLIAQLGPDDLTRFTPCDDHRRQAAEPRGHAGQAARLGGGHRRAGRRRGVGRRPDPRPARADRRRDLHLRAGGAALRIADAAQRPGLLRARIGTGDLARSGSDPVVATLRAAGLRARSRLDSSPAAPETRTLP